MIDSTNPLGEELDITLWLACRQVRKLLEVDPFGRFTEELSESGIFLIAIKAKVRVLVRNIFIILLRERCRHALLQMLCRSAGQCKLLETLANGLLGIQMGRCRHNQSR